METIQLLKNTLIKQMQDNQVQYPDKCKNYLLKLFFSRGKSFNQVEMSLIASCVNLYDSFQCIYYYLFSYSKLLFNFIV